MKLKFSKNPSPWMLLAISAMLMAWNGIVLGVTAYAVFWLGHSGWWFLLAVFLLVGFD